MGRPTKHSLAKGSATHRIEGIPLWVKNALTRHVLEDKQISTIAKEMGRDAKVIQSYAISPAGEDWMIGVRQAGNDPREFARKHLESLTLNMTIDNLWALEMAKRCDDYKTVKQMTEWWIARPEMLGALQKETAPVINVIVNGANASLEPKMVESTHAEVRIEGQTVEGAWEEVKRDD